MKNIAAISALIFFSTLVFTAHAENTDATTTTFGGYGEMNYNHYSRESSRSIADLKRFVFSLDHRFSDKLSFNGEVEWEHAVTSATDAGETAIEQAELTYRLTPNLNAKVGLMLIPMGFLNESHEPPVYYGVERNEVETRIIPSTWREGGFSLKGETEIALTWQAGVSTGFNAAQFDNAGKPLGSMRQTMSKAKASDPSFFAALNYRGVPGFLVGASVFTGKSAQGNAEFKADPTKLDLNGADGLITIYDLHSRWQGNGLDVQVLYAQGTIGDALKIDQAIDTFNIANPGSKLPYMPAKFSGWYGQLAYQVWASADMSLTPFVRHEQYNTQTAMPTGYTASSANADRVWTYGFSFKPHPEVVLKTDYQKYADSNLKDRFNIGAGYMF